MKTLLTSLIMALTTFFAVFAGLTIRSTQSEAVMFWELERLTVGSKEKNATTLNEFANTLRSKARDPDLRTCADYEYRRSSAMLRLGLDSLANSEDSVAIVGTFISLWRRPTGLLLLADAMAQAPIAESARFNCLKKFSETDADRTNMIVAGLSAILTFPLVQTLRRYQIKNGSK